jgi:hypothetical protein
MGITRSTRCYHDVADAGPIPPFPQHFSSWETLFQQAADFASAIAPDRLINISHDCDPAREGTACIWYWDDEPADDAENPESE